MNIDEHPTHKYGYLRPTLHVKRLTKHSYDGQPEVVEQQKFRGTF